MGELLPLKTKSITSSVGVIGTWMSSFLITKEIFDLESVLKNYGAFWLFAALNVAATLFVAAFLPETKGKSLEEIEELFRKSQKNQSAQNICN